MQATRERMLVGLFVLVAGGLLIVTVLSITGGMHAAGVAHHTYFKFAGGVQPGAPVRFGGLSVGKVERVRVDPGNSTRIEIDFLVDRDTPLKTDSIAKITTLGPLTDNYIEITTGSEQAAPLPPGAAMNSVETFGLPQLGEAVQAMLPDVQKAILKLNANLDGLQSTLAKADDLLNDRNRGAIAHSLANVDQMLAETRPKLNESLNHVNGMLNDAQPKISASLANVEELTARLSPLLDDVKKTNALADETLTQVNAALVENRPDIRATVTGLRDALAKSTVLLDSLNQTLDQNSDNIDELLDNMRLSTENLRSLTETLRSSPAAIIRGVHVEDRKPGGLRK